MVKLLLLCLLVFGIQLEAGEYPDPKIWAEEVPEKILSGAPGFIRNVYIFSANEQSDKRWQQSMLEFSSLAFLQYIDSQTMQFASKLNPKKGLDLKIREIPLELMAAHLILQDEGNQILAEVRGKTKLRTLARWPITEDDKQSSKNLLAWLTRNIGYDAVVLDKRDNLLLVALLTPSNELGQGILIQNSKRLWALKPEKIRGEALLQMVRIEGYFAVFEILLQNRSKNMIEAGSKVILGQNRSLEKLIKSINLDEIKKN